MEDIKMKKTYIAPETLEHKINIEPLLGINSVNENEAGEGGENNTVNFSRGGGLIWELEEVNDEE